MTTAVDILWVAAGLMACIGMGSIVFWSLRQGSVFSPRLSRLVYRAQQPILFWLMIAGFCAISVSGLGLAAFIVSRNAG